MGWIDGHCHLSDARVFGKAKSIVRDCAASGIDRFLLGGVNPEEWERQAALAREFPGKIGLVWGLHPWWVHDRFVAGDRLADFAPALARLREAAPGLAGVGELGLDHVRDRRAESAELQAALFRAQLAIARETGSAIVLHVVQAHTEALAILKEEGAAWRGIVHSFSGDWSIGRRYLELGLALSISGRVTYPEAKALRETVRQCPPESLVFETDSPDQPPLNATSEHTPQSLLRVVEEASRIRGEAPDVLLGRSRDFLERTFRWKP